ncbi:MAG: class I SAM-dependent methyltransferase [Myxococcales bacterium]|nr:class I SAM-dependent methyltransferase [Myxococcales bacterium]
MAHRDWNARYIADELPWDTGRPCPHLVDLLSNERIPKPRRVLDVGCGTGTNALWLAARGCEVVGVDISPRAIERARSKAAATPELTVEFRAVDFLTDDSANDLFAGAFDFVFDRGVLHVFDEAAERTRFAARVAAALEPGGHWLSLAGSTEGPARDSGPPRRSLRELAEAIEPSLEIVRLHTVDFDTDLPVPAWLVISRARELPAQPSS